MASPAPHFTGSASSLSPSPATVSAPSSPHMPPDLVAWPLPASGPASSSTDGTGGIYGIDAIAYGAVPAQFTNQDCVFQGRQDLEYNSSSPTNGPSSWNPNILLDPRHFAYQPESRPQTPGNAPLTANGDILAPPETTATALFGPAPASSEVAFRFMAPSDALLPVANGSGAVQVQDPMATDAMATVPGMAALVEQNYLLKNRSDIPEPKRRKVSPSSGTATPILAGQNGTSGILADGITSAGKADEAQAKNTKNAITVDLTDNNDSEDVKRKESYEEVCYGMLTGVAVQCHKLPLPKPGIQAMGGPAYWPAVKIVLRRIENDKTNVIKVYDYTREVFGSLDARSAKCLAPLMDLGCLHLRTEARIPSRRRSEEEVPHHPLSKVYRIELVLYGASNYAMPVFNRLAKAGLHVVTPHRMEPGIRLVLPQRPLNTAPSQPTGNSGGPGGAGGAGGSGSTAQATTWTASHAPPPSFQTRTMEDIRSEVMAVFDSLTHADDLPEMEPDQSVITPLLRHQKQALFFMQMREKPMAEQANIKYMSSIWQRKTDRVGYTVYHNVITGQTLQQPPAETLGGILADMMGLGKTLSVLSLVASTQEAADTWYDMPPKQPVDAEKKKKPSSIHPSFDVPVPHELGLTKLKRNGRGTLLVCPLSTITNWEEQIKQHLKPESIKYHIYHGPNRIKDAKQLSEFDLVITTYGSVSSELTGRNNKKAGPFPLEEIGWFRIVLDEAHMIREPNTLQYKAITRLQASRRWAVTGTPVQNRLEDLGSLISFLRLQPFDNRSRFTHHIVNRFRACDPDVLPQLRVLVDTITLRRLKDKIDLPPRTDVTARLDFSADERAIYDFFEREASDRVKVLTSQSERLLGGKTYIHILQSILRLRLICAHGKDLLGEEDLKRMWQTQREKEERRLQGTSLESAISLDDDDDDMNGSVRPPPAESQMYEFFDLMVNANNDMCIHCRRKITTQGADANVRSEREKQEDVVGYMTPCYHVLCPECVTVFRDEQRDLAYNCGQPGRCPFCQEMVLFSCPEIRRDRAEGEHDAPRHEGPGGEGARAQATAQATAAAETAAAAASSAAAAAAADGLALLEAYTGPHTKTRALVAELLELEQQSAMHPEEAPIKSVVFSGWTSHLDLIERALRAANISFCRLDGKMSRPARTQAMDTFREDPAVRVILVSIMAGGLGLNLTAGSHVYVMEPQYNPAAEAQAVDRVHRLGQKRPVRTVRYIMNNSFEEKMLDLQAAKIKLANLSMNRSDRMSVADAARQRLQDLRRLFK